MNKERQVKALAKKIGFTNISGSLSVGFVGCLQGIKGVIQIPDYSKDLNAIQEAWEKLVMNDPVMRVKWRHHIRTALIERGRDKDGNYISASCSPCYIKLEALLKTIDAWEQEDSKEDE